MWGRKEKVLRRFMCIYWVIFYGDGLGFGGGGSFHTALNPILDRKVLIEQHCSNYTKKGTPSCRLFMLLTGAEVTPRLRLFLLSISMIITIQFFLQKGETMAGKTKRRFFLSEDVKRYGFCLFI